MKKSWIWFLIIPLISEAADLNQVDALFDLELAKVDEELLLQVEKMSVKKPSFPWVDDEVMDEQISLYIENEAQEIIGQSNFTSFSGPSSVSEQEKEFFPVYEEVPARANRFWTKRPLVLDTHSSKAKPKRTEAKEGDHHSALSSDSPKKSIDDSNRISKKNVKKSVLKKQTAEKKAALKKAKSANQAQAKKDALRAKQKSSVVKNLEQQTAEKTRASHLAKKSLSKGSVTSQSKGEAKLQKSAAQFESDELHNEVTTQVESPEKSSHALPEYFPSWDTE